MAANCGCIASLNVALTVGGDAVSSALSAGSVDTRTACADANAAPANAVDGQPDDIKRDGHKAVHDRRRTSMVSTTATAATASAPPANQRAELSAVGP